MNIEEKMKKAVKAYEYIDSVGKELAEVIGKQIEPLLAEKKYKEAKEAVDLFYKPSRWKSEDSDSESEREGDIIFIERDMIMANINRLIRLNTPT